jgi:hypothetical protein
MTKKESKDSEAATEATAATEAKPDTTTLAERKAIGRALADAARGSRRTPIR